MRAAAPFAVNNGSMPGHSPRQYVQHAAVHTVPAPAQCSGLPVQQEWDVARSQAAVDEVSTVLQESVATQGRWRSDTHHSCKE
jgi:hypothetical protein